MKKWLLLLTILLASCSYATASNPEHGGTPNGCGVQRWPVKTGTDADAGKIDLSTPPSQTTISQLVTMPSPAVDPLPQSSRIQPFETTVYQITATLTKFKIEDDQDIHGVIASKDPATDKTVTMIVELPNSGCVDSDSLLLPSIIRARGEFITAGFKPTTSWQVANVLVTVTGVGFWDDKHGQTGVAQNPGADAIELHPLTDFREGS